MITDEQINHFKEKGWVTVPVFSREEVAEMRLGYHNWLRTFGVNPSKLEKEMYYKLPKDHTPHMNCYYSPFKLLNYSVNERVWRVMSKLWSETFATGKTPGFEHRMGAFDPEQGYVSLDRASFRFPKSIIGKSSAGSKGLELHVDRNPYYPPKDKWRPIQMSLALVDHEGDGKDGGIGIVPGFHLEFDEYFRTNKIFHKRQFVVLDKKNHSTLWDRVEWIRHPAGSLMLWDNRMPHLTAPENDRPNGEAREVFFSSFLPNVYPNDVFVKNQLAAFLRNDIPPQYVVEMNRGVKADAKQLSAYNFSDLQRKLMGLDSYSQNEDSDS